VFALLQTSERVSHVPSGYGVALLQTLLALAAVCILAWVVLRWSAQRRLFGAGGGERVRVLERVHLDPRRALYLVKVGEKVLLLGAGDNGAPALLTEVDPASLPKETASAKGGSFADVMKRLAGKKDAP
jgi:flagellar biosynthetic protein FliO